MSIIPPEWRAEVRALADAIERRARHTADAIELVVDRDPYHVAGYRGYAAAGRGLVLGRALQNERIPPPDPAHGRWRNLLHALERLESDPLPFARVRARVAGADAELRADDEGFVRSWVELPVTPAAGWEPVRLELSHAGQPPPAATGLMLVPPPGCRFGVVSDMDDTVIQSRVRHFLRAAGLVLLENARTRLPFPGVSAFYRALVAGAGGAEANPLFYVSNSPWNLYDVVADFLEAQRIPAGPLLLRDWDFAGRLRGHPAHKPTAIAEILEAYPRLPFMLIGDSGQEDPEIYSALVRAHPGRILAVYIRNVHPHPERVDAVRRLAEEVVAAGSVLVLAEDTLTLARHAVEHGWIAPGVLDEIANETRADTGDAGAKTPAPGVEPPQGTPPVVVEGPGDLP